MTKPKQSEPHTAHHLRTELRGIAGEHEGPLSPRILREESRISLTDLIDEFGSVAAGAIQSGVEYFNPNPREATIAVLGEKWEDRKPIERLQSSRMEVLRNFRGSVRQTKKSAIDEFGTLDALRIEAGTVDEDSEEWTPTAEYIDRLRRVASELGYPPTEKYRTDPPLETTEYVNRFGSWDNALRAADLDPDEQSRQEELASYLRKLADTLGHPPTATEIDAYRGEVSDWGMPRAEYYESIFGDLPSAWELAGLPPHRNLKPDSDLESAGTIEGVPTHTDLLAELYSVFRTPETGTRPPRVQFEERGMIDEKHYTVQFGSLENAVDVLTDFDETYFE